MRLFFSLIVFVLLLGCAQPEEVPKETPQAELPSGAIEETPEGPEIIEEPIEEPAQAPPPEVPPEEPAVPAEELKSKEITYAAFSWEIHGTLYPNANPTKVIILVPMLDHTRESYPQSFIKRLHDEIPDAMVLAIDPRGHGESTNLGTWEDFETADFKDMSNDILESKKYFMKNYPTVKEYYVVGASIGSTSAMLAGWRDNDVTKIAMLSPGMEYQDVSLDRAVDDYIHDLFIAAASGDSYSASSASQIKSASSSHVTLKIYPGSAHGTALFDATKEDSEPLEDALVKFLK